MFNSAVLVSPKHVLHQYSVCDAQEDVFSTRLQEFGSGLRFLCRFRVFTRAGAHQKSATCCVLGLIVFGFSPQDVGKPLP